MAVPALENTQELNAYSQVEFLELELASIIRCGFRTGYVNESAVTSLKANTTLRPCQERSLESALSGANLMRVILETKTFNFPIELLTQILHRS